MENAIQNCTKIITDAALHERFALYGKNAREWTRKCALLLPEIEKREIWRKRGFSSIYDYARILAGMSANAVNDAMRILKKAEDKPSLKWVIEKKGINAVRPIIAIATAETADFWADKAMEINKNTLEAYVKEFKKTHTEAKIIKSNFCTSTKNGQTQNFFPEINLRRVEMYIKPEIAEKLEKLKNSGSWDELMEKLLTAHEEKIEAQKPAPVENAKRYVPVAIKRHALAKTNGTCAFPGCSKPYEILHHTKRFALTHAHDPDALVPLCKAHERLVHLGLIENESHPPSEWCVRAAPDKSDQKYKIDRLVVQHRAAAG